MGNFPKKEIVHGLIGYIFWTPKYVEILLPAAFVMEKNAK